jgi:TPR repeat protein
MDGAGVPRDVGEARRWLGLAALRGYAAAQYKLGWLYANGEGSDRDLREAAYWFRQAARQDDSLSLYALGLMAANGEGIGQDPVTAFALLSVSASGGYEGALEARKQLEATMTAGEVRRGQDFAANWAKNKEALLNQLQDQP